MKPETRNQKPEGGAADARVRFLVSGFWFLV
jgi:hypothetical protein